MDGERLLKLPKRLPFASLLERDPHSITFVTEASVFRVMHDGFGPQPHPSFIEVF